MPMPLSSIGLMYFVELENYFEQLAILQSQQGGGRTGLKDQMSNFFLRPGETPPSHLPNMECFAHICLFFPIFTSPG